VMSVRYQWVERAEAWDLYLDRYRQLAQVTDIERMRSLIPSTMRRVPSSFSSRSSNSSDLFKTKTWCFQSRGPGSAWTNS
jgi:hypothetical protein